MKYKTITGPDGKMETVEDNSHPAEQAVKDLRKSLRDMLEGGGWYEEPKDPAAPVAPKLCDSCGGSGEMVDCQFTPIGPVENSWPCESCSARGWVV